MPTATQILRNEHDAILKMLDASEEVARQLDRSERVAPETLAGILEFFRVFADQCHHGKEEDLLFPALAAKGMPHQGGPIGVMEAEHEVGRSLIRQMAEAAHAYEHGEQSSGFIWAKVAREYAEFLRNHIAKENNVLFVMAERMLSPDEQSRLATEFARMEKQKMGAGTHERLHRKMEQLLNTIQKQTTAA
jgi:hemerythrin-like domain-containing protein